MIRSSVLGDFLIYWIREGSSARMNLLLGASCQRQLLILSIASADFGVGSHCWDSG